MSWEQKAVHYQEQADLWRTRALYWKKKGDYAGRPPTDTSGNAAPWPMQERDGQVETICRKEEAICWKKEAESRHKEAACWRKIAKIWHKKAVRS